jgi:hypothetical protein
MGQLKSAPEEMARHPSEWRAEFLAVLRTTSAPQSEGGGSYRTTFIAGTVSITLGSGRMIEI